MRGLVRTTSDLRSLQGLELERCRATYSIADSLASAMQGCDVVFHTAGIFTYWAREEQQLESVVLEGTRNTLRGGGIGRGGPVSC